MVYQVSGLVLSSLLDQSAENGSISTSQTTLSCTTGALASAFEIAIGIGYGGHSTSYTASSGFTNLTNFAGASANGVVGVDYQLTASASALTFAPSWSPSGAANAVAVATFIGSQQVPWTPIQQLGPIQAQ